MRRALLSLAAGVVLGSGCFAEDPDDVFYYFGSVTDAQGHGLAATSTLSSTPGGFSGACTVTGRTTVFLKLSGGLAATAPFTPLRDAVSDQDGSFYFDLMRFEIMPTRQSFNCFAMSARSSTGARAVAASGGIPRDLEFPALALWEGALALAPGAPPRVSLPALPWAPSSEEVPVDDLGSTRRTYYAWSLTGPGGELAWYRRTETDPLDLLPELTEDFAGLQVHLQAWLADLQVRVGGVGISVPTDYRSTSEPPPLAVPASGRVPVSRGASCVMNGATLVPCPLTDGKLDLTLLPSWEETVGPNQPLPDTPSDVVVLALPRPVIPRVMVARDLHALGAPLGLQVEGSSDGTTWIPLALAFADPAQTERLEGFAGTGQSLWVDLDSSGAAVTQVRLTTTAYSAIAALRELSIFE